MWFCSERAGFDSRSILRTNEISKGEAFKSQHSLNQIQAGMDASWSILMKGVDSQKFTPPSPPFNLVGLKNTTGV